MLGRHGLTGRIARQQFAAFAQPSRSMSSFRPQISRLPVRSGKTLSGTATWRTSMPSISGAATIRFNSTSSATASGAVPDASAAANSGSNVPGADQFDVDFDISSIPERIGYLKDLGLDFGWGPTSVMQFVVEHLHIWGGLPWIGSIIATGVLVRFAMLPLFYRAIDQGTKTGNIRHITGPIRAEMVRNLQEGKQAEGVRLRAELAKINKEHGIQTSAMFMPLFVQVFFGYGMFRLIRNMASLPVPGLAMEQFAWITDLTAHDPFFILPVVAATLQYLTIKKGGEFGNVDANMAGLQQAMRYVMPGLALLFTATLPAALQLYFAVTAGIGYAQSLAFNNVAVRQAIGMALPSKYITKPPGTPETEQSRHLRTLVEAAEGLQAEHQRRAVEADKQAQKAQMSVIDRALLSAKESKDKLVRETTDKVNEMTGRGPKKNADGTVAPPDRLSEKDRKLAEDYEKRRREEDEWKREELNHARREAHLQAMERQREQARTAWQRSKTKTKA
ncbi:60Kd inner membrane protein-domain-containing protein [Aspergillus pseudodeflectus]|uniref:60Kd inner membrane protein-domain-containing protein n=1 Tax=Aspergillus pseudodeflectus TaxID=176178 RepID=A0ABR4K0X9_9EURO